MPLFDKTIDVLSKSMDLQLLRQNIISDNIANAETPFYKARRVTFEEELQKAVDYGDMAPGVGDIELVKAKIHQDPFSELGQDLNTVDMDREMAEMTKNDVKYSAATQAVSKKFAMLKYAIGEGDR